MSSGAPPKLRAIFSDLDGTIVHFPAWFEEHGSKIVSADRPARRAVVESRSGERRECRLLPSSTMGDGLVSERTAELVAELRAHGILFVVVTAARKSTLIERWPLLPECDAAVCETGSRIYMKSEDEPDVEWPRRFEHITGPLDRELDVSDRPEPLWQFFRHLAATVDGLKCDSRSYYGCFRVDTKGRPDVEAALLAQIDAALPDGVAWAMNLGKYDFFPATSGKGNSVQYLQVRARPRSPAAPAGRARCSRRRAPPPSPPTAPAQRTCTRCCPPQAKFGVSPEECACLFDDDNDLPMANQCGYARHLPGLTSDSVRRAAAENPSWRVASKAGQGVFAIEQCLEELLEQVRKERQPEKEAVVQ
jgi:phosphoserine phosphatase